MERNRKELGRWMPLLAVICLCALAWAPAAAETVTFESRSYDALRDETTFKYRVRLGDRAIDEFTAGFGICSRLEVVDFSPRAGSSLLAVSAPQFDRSTGVFGVRWTRVPGETVEGVFSYTVRGRVPLGPVQVGLRKQSWRRAEVTLGPLCEPQVVGSRRAETRADAKSTEVVASR